MTLSTTVYTMGTALRRAYDSNLPVAVLVEGQWLTGHVVALDGHGVVMERDGVEHAVIRMERVSAVRVMSGLPVTEPRQALSPEADIA